MKAFMVREGNAGVRDRNKEGEIENEKLCLM